jgi:Holliday junction resolvase
MGAMSRRKGAAAEREVAELLRSHGFHARRGQQFSGSPDSPDVVHDIEGIHIEVKRTERFALYPALEQARQDRRAGDIPCVLHRQNGREWVAVLPAEDLLSILRVVYRRPA